MYPPLKLKVFVDDIKGAGRYCRERFEVNEKGKVEEMGLKLSITDGGKEGKSKVITSCGNMEEKFRECSKKKEMRISPLKERRPQQWD